MSWLTRWWRRGALDRDLDRELLDHVERRVADLVRGGADEAAARRQARLEIGGVEQVKEAVRDVRGTRWAHDLWQDLRFGARMLRKSPGLLVAALLSMGLGIGANTAIFSLVDAVLLRSLPVREPERLAVITGEFTNPIWEQVRDRADTLWDGALAWYQERLDLSAGGDVDPAETLMVSGSFFEELGVQPALGRLLGPADDRRGGSVHGPTAVISQRFWERRYGSDPGIVGRTVTLNHIPFTIAGVVPARFLGPTVGRSFDVAIPLGTVDLVTPGGPESALDGRSRWWLSIMVRLAPGQSVEAATAALRGVQPQIRDATLPLDWPRSMLARYLSDGLEIESASTGISDLRRSYEQPLLVLLGIVGVVLLVACANVANLLLARASARRHELAARLALGASHGRLVRQLLAESAVLAVPGAIAGLAIAVWGSRFLVAQISTSDSQVALDLPLDWRVLGFLTGLSVLSAVAFGLAPAWRARRLDAGDAVALAAHARMTRRGAVSGPLVAGQIALSLVLVIAAGLFGRTFSTLASRDLGLDPAHLHLAGIDAARVPVEQRVALYQRLRDAALGVPGVASAAVSMISPLSGMGWNGVLDFAGMAPLPERQRLVYTNAVTRGFFATHGTPILAGRDFDDRDRAGTPVAIVNEALARRFFGSTDVLGRRVRMGGGRGEVEPELEIIGVVETAAYTRVRGDFPPALYRPTSQLSNELLAPFLTLAVRTRPGVSAGVTASISEAVRQIDPTLTITHRTMASRVHDQLTQVRTVAILSSFFGVLALLLAAIGLYGVTSYGVAERQREIGIRLTLGAGRAGAQRLVLRGVARLVAIGIALGLGVSLLLTPLAATMLYSLEPRDPATMATAAVVLAMVGLLAGWLPARRASRIDPAKVLRDS